MDTSHLKRIASIVMGIALTACTNLPADWRNAAAVEIFTQSECTGNLADLERRGGERFAARAAGEGRLRIDYANAHFRCEQPVTAYAKVRGETVDVLVQPVDMNPSSVAKCACLYDVQLEVPRLAAGTYDVTLYRRGDNRNAPNEPVRIGTERVSLR